MNRFLRGLLYLRGLRSVPRYRSKLKKIRQLTVKSDEVVVFNLVRQVPVQMHIEFFLAFMLAKRGVRSVILIDDGALEHWDSIHDNDTLSHDNPMRAGYLSRIYISMMGRVVSWTYRHDLIQVRYYSSILKNYITPKLSESEALSVDKHAKSSCMRYNSSAEFWSDVENQDYYKISVKNALKTRYAAEVISNDFTVKKVITSHGIYSSWGPFWDYFLTKGVPTNIYEQLIYQNRSILITEKTHQELSEDIEWKGKLINPEKANLTKDQIKKVVKFYQNRIGYLGNESHYYFNIEKFNSIKIERSGKGKVFGMFPNVVWDGDIQERNIIFDGILHWVLSTIEAIRYTKNTLVIRFHPSESTLVTWAVSLEELLRQSLPEIDSLENIILIQSSFQLDLYSFIAKEIDIGLVYDGILGMEMTFMGVPNITAGKSRYADVGFSIEPKENVEYLRYLESPNFAINAFNETIFERKEMLMKFTHWYLYEAAFYLPIMDKNDFFEIDIDDPSYDDLDETLSPVLKRTLDRLDR